MKRKSWISLLTGMALLLTAVGNHSGGAVTVKAETATRQAAGHTHDMSVSCGQEQAISFTEWSDPTSMPDTAGNYCLTVDVTLAGNYNAWNVPEGSPICV